VSILEAEYQSFSTPTPNPKELTAIAPDIHEDRSLSKLQKKQQYSIEQVPKTEKAVDRQHSEHSPSGAPSVRLDMDLDVDIKMKAKIQGDLELSIL
jgi:hypothetical protein